MFAICSPIIKHITMVYARTLRSTRMLRSVDHRRQSVRSHQSHGSAASIINTLGWPNWSAHDHPERYPIAAPAPARIRFSVGTVAAALPAGRDDRRLRCGGCRHGRVYGRALPVLGGRSTHQFAPHGIGGLAAALVLFRRQVGSVAQPRLPFDGDDHRLAVVVGGRGRVMRWRSDSFRLTRCAWMRCPLLPEWGQGSKDLSRRLSSQVRAAAAFRGDDRRRLEHDCFPLPGRALVAVRVGDDAGPSGASFSHTSQPGNTTQLRASPVLGAGAVEITGSISKHGLCGGEIHETKEVTAQVRRRDQAARS